MNTLFKSKYGIAAVSVAVIIIIVLICNTVLSGVAPAKNSSAATADSYAQVNPAYSETVLSAEASTALISTEPSEAEPSEAEPSTAAPTKKSSDSKMKKPVSSTAAITTTAEPSTPAQIIPFATAIPPKTKADYAEQWNQGYLVAIDNPDKTYACSKVNLTEEDRDLLERLCMGEFGSGGFIGAALIAQAVKDAMCFDGYPTVESVIKGCRYDGRTDVGTNDACRMAVRYIFDDNGEAVQHRIMYMYNPYLVRSAFHESQNYILSYKNVRFFDRWNY